jgi:predicted glycosyltransferase involved in capsule biosynthesis
MSNNITFICHLKIDNELRIKNITNVIKFYHTNILNAEFIFVEERNIADTYNLENYLPDNINCKIISLNTDNNTPVRKCECYNRGVVEATNDILIFLDVDVIVNPELFIPEIEQLYNDNILDMHVGYNGIALYMTNIGESNFLKTGDITDLDNTWRINNNRVQLRSGMNTKDFLCGNIAAVGGFLVLTKKSFYQINGFNPNFKGWGFEDNEIVTRGHKLGLTVTKSNNINNVLYHLPHISQDIDKSKHNFYKHNESEFIKIKTMDKSSLKSYTQLWSTI